MLVRLRGGPPEVVERLRLRPYPLTGGVEPAGELAVVHVARVPTRCWDDPVRG